MTSTNSDRLFKLLGELSPELLFEAFPEAAGSHNATSFRSSHAKRIGRMILLYAACAVLLVGAIVYLPKLFNQSPSPPVTTVPNQEETPLDYPADYFRPDLVWANENVDLRKENVVVGQYHAIDFEFLEDDSAVYAVYMKYMNGEYLTAYSQDLGSKSGADFELLRVSSAEKYRIVEDTKARYYAGTRAQIEAYFDYIEKTYQTEDESQRIRICLAYQTLRPSIIDGKWNPDLLKPSEITGYETTGVNPSYADCIRGSADTPLIGPNAKEITFRFVCGEHLKGLTKLQHTVSYQPKGPDISVLIDGTWYDIPWVAPSNAKDANLEVPEDGEVSLTLSFADFPHGDLPAGQYRIIFPFKATHTSSSLEVYTQNDLTHAVLFMVSSGDDCISPGATQGLAYTLLEDGTYGVSASAFIDMQATEIVIPSVYCGIPVTSVSEFGFGRYNFGHDTPYALRSVTLPNTITTIGEEAFVGCPNLQRINLPDSLTAIGTRAFSGCNLEEVVLPLGITEIAEYAFDGNRLSKLVLPDTLVSIGYRAFQGCGVTEVVIPASVNFIAEDAFGSCANLRSAIFEDLENWIASNRMMDLSSPSENAHWLAYSAFELKRGTLADIDTSQETARWSIEDANIDFAFASYEDAEHFALSYAQQNKGCFPIPRIDDPNVKVSYHFYGIVDRYDEAAGRNQNYRAGMMVVTYEDQDVIMEGQFYALSFVLDPGASMQTRELSHDYTLRTYVYTLNETVFADLAITVKDSTLWTTDVLQIRTILMLSNQLELLGI